MVNLKRGKGQGVGQRVLNRIRTCDLPNTGQGLNSQSCRETDEEHDLILDKLPEYCWGQ